MKSSVSEVNHALEDLVTLSNGLKENFVVALKAAGALDLERKKEKKRKIRKRKNFKIKSSQEN